MSSNEQQQEGLSAVAPTSREEHEAGKPSAQGEGEGSQVLLLVLLTALLGKVVVGLGHLSQH